MAAPSATALEAATAFIQTHTLIVPGTELSPFDECPVCLETYNLTAQSEHACKIINIPNCEHVIGLSCLTAILTANGSTEKKCPLCRTVWIPSRVPAALMDMRRRLQALGAIPGGSSEGGRDAGPRHVINIESDSDSDEEVTLESYTQFSRDIADIRTRARNTQLSRRERRDAARTASGNGANDRHLFARGHASARQVLQPDSLEAAPRPGQDPFERLVRHYNRQPNPVDRMELGISPSPSPEPVLLDMHPGRATNDRNQPTDRHRRDTDELERRLVERERALHERERHLFQREQRIAQREKNMERFVNVRKRQLEEVEQLVVRHREELRRLEGR
ncbi:hypothetical protein BU26DRAFT_604263 [Trematosphaeria pertusa]|uniref:RING-type domain-containing protein n=1 Tax=Trematosphaeria pertusa TaxID=390896 RepID=A0A6A6IIW2_9PLEO|nr:uncharacterized protein BU26DRAFT_604263 [Trematosphaeria pertusa]KAF2249988.1 hypothetical protein BU26DRAFT_604263 [Trematosphaeria pertusa]